MHGRTMQERAKQLVVCYFNSHVDATDFREIFSKMALKNAKSRVYKNGENYNTALADVIDKPVFTK